MIQLKDVLHYYLGCGIELDNGGSKVTNRKLIAVGGVDDEPYAKLRMGNAGKDQFVHAVLLKENRIKPILRSISSMTSKEALSVFHISYEDAKYEFSECAETDNGWRARNQNGMECYLPNGTFKPAAFHYLLSKGFDLFGLIESNQAITKPI